MKKSTSNDNPSTITNLASLEVRVKTAIQIGDYNSAEKELKAVMQKIRAHSLEPDQQSIARLKILQGLLKVKQGHPTDAIAMLEQAFKELNLDDELCLEPARTMQSRLQSLPLEVPIMIEACLAQIEAFYLLGKNDEALKKIEAAKTLLDACSMTNRKLLEAELLYLQGSVLWRKGNLNQALQHLNVGLELARNFPKEKTVLAKILNRIGTVYQLMGDFDNALKYYKQSLGLWERLGNINDLAIQLNNIGTILFNQGDFEAALEYLTRSLRLYEQVGSPQHIAGCLNNIGIIIHIKGNLDQALQHYQKSLKLWKKSPNPVGLAELYKNMGYLYREMGKHDKAIKCLKKSLTLREEVGNPFLIAESLFYLIVVHLDLRHVDDCHQYFIRLEKLTNQNPNTTIEILFRVARALMLKHRPRAKYKWEAHSILEQVYSERITDFHVRVLVLLNICDLLIWQHELTEETEILEEIDEVISQLLQVARTQQSHLLLAQTYWLKAKVALIKGQVDDARMYLTQAQILAEELGLSWLASQISKDHDKLLSHESLIDILSQGDLTITEKMRLVGLKGFMGKLVRKELLETLGNGNKDKMSPVFLLIIHKNGILLHAKEFSQDVSKPFDLIGGFLGALDSFSRDAFSRSLDRIRLGEYTVVMLPLGSLLLALACKGSSFAALELLQQLGSRISSSSEVHQELLNAAENSKPISPRIQRKLDNIINDLFKRANG